MYEASFGLKRRPFAATPDATCFLSSGPIQAALDELVVCVEHGQGIAVLTAPAGTGKTLVCERLRVELDERYETVFLRHASFLTRRALLQTVLCELNHAYHHPSEQELRLELFPAIRALQPKREALVLICDEAHQLTDSLLEELRILADFAESGRPLVRLVLVGQLSLEEKLAQPGLDAFNQRIRAHVNLATFDQAESIDYIDYRITWAGGRTDEVFTPEALDLIARASDGVPRCINQLADHTLLLAFVAEQRPASAELVREALSDLRQLPLHWNEPASDRTSTTEFQQLDHHPELEFEQHHAQKESSGFLLETKVGSPTYAYEPETCLDETSQQLDAPDPRHAVNSIVSDKLAHGNDSGVVEMNREQVESEDWRQVVEQFNPNKLAELIAETFDHSTVPLEDAQDRLNLTRPNQLHDLLTDAYEAAGFSPNPSSESSRPAFVSNDKTPEPQSFVASGERDRIVLENCYPSIISDPNLISSQPIGGFHEELIVDRYTSIDSGLEPPVFAFPETTHATEVRAHHPSPDRKGAGLSDPCCSAVGLNSQDTTSCQRAFETSDRETTITSFMQAMSHRCFEATMEAPAKCDQGSLGSASNALMTEEADPETVAAPADLDQLLPSLHLESQLEVSVVDISDQRSRADVFDFVETSDQSMSNPIQFNSGNIEQVAAEVQSIAETLRPSGVLSSTSESLLSALRHEVEESSTIIRAESQKQSLEVANQSAWESVETPVAPPTTENRPFRYLFSMLRRKQHGLS